MPDLTAQHLPSLRQHRLPGFETGSDWVYPAYEGGSIVNLPATICQWLGASEFGVRPLDDEIGMSVDVALALSAALVAWTNRPLWLLTSRDGRDEGGTPSAGDGHGRRCPLRAAMSRTRPFRHPPVAPRSRRSPPGAPPPRERRMTAARDLPPFARLPGALAPLGYRNYLLFWIGFVASNAGKWVEQTGAVWIAYELTGNPFLLGLLGIIRAIPTIALTPFAGVIADRVDQRKLLFATQSLSLVLSLAIGLLVATGRVELWHLYLEVTLQAAVNAVDAVARQSLFPRLIPRDHLVEAVTLQSMASRVSNLIGPAIGGFAIAGLGEAAPFFINGASFLCLMVALGFVTGISARVVAARESFVTELAEGFRYILRTPILRSLILLEGFYGLFAMNQVMITLVARDELGVGPEGLGGLLSADAVGASLGVVALLLVGATARPGRFAILATFGYAASLAGFAVAGGYVLCFGALIGCGFFDVLVSVTRNSLMQLAAPAGMRGRVMANQGMIVRGMAPLSQSQSGFAAGLLGAPLATVLAGALMAAGAVGVLRGYPGLWTIDRDEVIRRPEPRL